MFKAKYSLFELIGFAMAISFANSFKPYDWRGWALFFGITIVFVGIQTIVESRRNE